MPQTREQLKLLDFPEIVVAHQSCPTL